MAKNSKLETLKKALNNKNLSDEMKDKIKKQISVLEGVSSHEEEYIVEVDGEMFDIRRNSDHPEYKNITASQAKKLAKIHRGMEKKVLAATIKGMHAGNAKRFDEMAKSLSKLEPKKKPGRKPKGLKAVLKDAPAGGGDLKKKKSTKKTGKKKEKATDVIFLVKEGDDDIYGADLYAFFYKDEETSNLDPLNVAYAIYSTDSQHSKATAGYALESRLATPKEYASLKKELESAPYNYSLKIAKSKDVIPGYNASNEDEGDWKDIALQELRDHEDNQDLEKAYYGEEDSKFEAESGNTSYVIFESLKDAEREAEERVKSDLEDEPGMFNQDFLNNYLYVSDTDKRVIADESADAAVDGMDDDDPERESTRDEVYERWYNGLDKDPIDFLTSEEGLYSKEEALKQTFIRINTREAAEAAIREDGVAHFLAYDHEQIDLPSGAVAFRTN